MEEPAFAVSIQSFLDEVSTGKPTPGGGSVAAVVGALGCATSAMATVMAAKRRDLDAADHQVLEQHLRGVKKSISYLEELGKADEKSFEEYLQARHQTQQSEEAQQRRDLSLQRSIIAATEIPMVIANECLKTLERVQDIARFVQPRFLSDVGVSAVLLEAAGQAALLLVDANLHVIQDESFRMSAKSNREHLRGYLSEVRAKVMAAVGDS